MKIKEVIERECCQNRDLKVITGHPVGCPYYFCVHCGKHWHYERYMDAAGSPDSRLTSLPLPWVA